MKEQREQREQQERKAMERPRRHIRAPIRSGCAGDAADQLLGHRRIAEIGAPPFGDRRAGHRAARPIHSGTGRPWCRASATNPITKWLSRPSAMPSSTSGAMMTTRSRSSPATVRDPVAARRQQPQQPADRAATARSRALRPRRAREGSRRGSTVRRRRPRSPARSARRAAQEDDAAARLASRDPAPSRSAFSIGRGEV